jgi:hypothetical protein
LALPFTGPGRITELENQLSGSDLAAMRRKIKSLESEVRIIEQSCWH